MTNGFTATQQAVGTATGAIAQATALGIGIGAAKVSLGALEDLRLSGRRAAAPRKSRRKSLMGFL
jgi:hypothetical protein